MGMRLLIALVALGALIGLVAVLLVGDNTVPLHAADVAPDLEVASGSMAAADQDVSSVEDRLLGDASTRTSAFTQDQDRDPADRGLLIVETLLNGQPHHRVQVVVRGDSALVRTREDTGPWTFSVPAETAVVLDITEEDSGWTQTETTLAPTAGDVRTLTVDLDPPQIDGEILLQVRSDAGGKPIVGARVVAISEAPPDVAIFTTDGGGNARVPRGPGLSYVVSHSAHGAVSLPAFSESHKAFQLVTLRTFARLFGTIQTRGGIQTRVQLMGGDPAVSANRRAIASASVDVSGAWAMEGITVPQGQEALSGVWLELESGTTMRTLAADLRIEPGASLEVVDPWRGGLPIALEFIYPSGTALAPGTNVFLRREADPPTGSDESQRGLTDDQGRIQFPALIVGEWTCEVGPAKLTKLVVTGDPIQTVQVQDYDCIAGSLQWPASSERGRRPARVVLEVNGKTLVQQSGAFSGGRFRFDFVPTPAVGLISASVADRLSSRREGNGFFSSSDAFSSGEPIEVAPGDLNVSLALTLVSR